MKYRDDKYGNPVSVLGYGCMRFPRKGGMIQMKETEEQIMAAIEGGVNYFDTAYIYPGSEATLGEILEKNGVREKVHIATKLPHYLIKSSQGMDKIFEEELRRLRTDYVDYYLMHMLTDVESWEKIKALGIEEWIADKKKSGQIRQIGFSYHGNSEMFCKLVDAYDWDFCMIQYNYMDEHSQAGRRGLQYAHEKGLPVMIMEPLRGGKLAHGLPEEARKLFREYPVKRTPAGWSFGWLWNQPEVTCVLSGMNSLEMIAENMELASEISVGDYTEAEEKLLQKVLAAISAKMKVGCTGCGYCMPCPAKVDIPGAFAAYNRRFTEGKFWALSEHVKCSALRREPTSAFHCVECGKCEAHCPQQISIRKELKAVSKELEGPLYRLIVKANQRFKLF